MKNSFLTTICVLITIISYVSKAQSGSQPFTSSGIFTVPVGIDSMTVECVGAGGSGGGNGTGGGGGGGYAKKTFPVVAGTNYNVTIGLGGNGTSTGISTLSIFGLAGANGVSVSNPNIGGGGAGGNGVGGTINHTGGTGGGGYYTYFGGGGGGAAGAAGNGFNGGNTIAWTGICLTPGGTGGASGGIPGGNGGKGAGFTDPNCNVTDPAAGGSNFGGGGGGGNGNGGAPGTGANGYVLISWSTCTSPSAPTGNSNQTFCNAATVADLTATGTGVQWYNLATGGTPLNNTVQLVDGSHYYATQTIGTCESTNSFDVTVAITVTPEPTGQGMQVICHSGTVDSLDISGVNILWYNAFTGGQQIPSTTPLVMGIYYWATQTINGCESATRFGIQALLQTYNDSVTVTGNTITAIGGQNYQWIDCSNNNQNIPGATNMSYTATQNGSYAVVLGHVNCSDTSVCINITGIDIKEVMNPADVLLCNSVFTKNIVIIQPAGGYNFQLHNAVGQLIWEGKQIEQHDFSNLPNGIYLLKAKRNSITQTIKLVKE